MKRLSVFEQFIYEFEAPPEILSTALEIALRVPYRANRTNYTTDDPDTRNEPGMSSVRGWIDQCLEEVRKDLEFECEEIRSTIEWFNMSHKSMWHQPHNHDNSFLSGVFYLTSSDAETWFSIESIFGPDYTLFNLIDQKNRLVFHKNPTSVGKMLVFPSKINHSVTHHNDEEPRYSLAFNAFPSGFIGTRTSEVYRKFMNISVQQSD